MLSRRLLEHLHYSLQLSGRRMCCSTLELDAATSAENCVAPQTRRVGFTISHENAVSGVTVETDFWDGRGFITCVPYGGESGSMRFAVDYLTPGIYRVVVMVTNVRGEQGYKKHYF